MLCSPTLSTPSASSGRPRRDVTLRFDQIYRALVSQRLIEIGDQIIGIFDSDRDPDQRVREPDLFAQFLRHAGMRGRSGVTDQRLRAAETDRELAHSELVEKDESLPLAAPDVERIGRARRGR